MTTREYCLTQVNRPSCSRGGIDGADVEYDPQNFGTVIMSTTRCSSCGFRHSDVFSLSAHEPTATSLKVMSAEDLKIRVVRGNTATILVPEFGVSIQPGLNNEGVISDVEGVLAKAEGVLCFLAGSLLGRKKQRADALLRKIARAREGRLRFTLQLKDPLGNSTIMSGKAKNRLKFGEHAVAAGKRS